MHLVIVAGVGTFNVSKLIGWDPANNNLFNVNNRNIRKRCEIRSKSTTKIVERHSDAFMVKFEHISYLFLM